MPPWIHTEKKKDNWEAGPWDRAIHVLDLASWIDGDDPRFPPEQIQTIAELISGQKVEQGSSVVGLTTAEWIERWRKYRRQDPGR